MERIEKNDFKGANIAVLVHRTILAVRIIAILLEFLCMHSQKMKNSVDYGYNL